jgi:predicted XRE-type DNA-binding protein
MTAKSFTRAELFLKIKNKNLKQTEVAKMLNLSLRHINDYTVNLNK